MSFPELDSHPDYALAKQLLPKGCGAVFSFSIKGDRAAGRRFVEALKIFSHLANVGDATSLVIHPASTTHFRVLDRACSPPPASRKARCACRSASKTPDDLIEDLARGLKASQRAK